MRRPLLLSACSATLLLLVSTATGQEQEENVAASAAGITPTDEDETTLETDGKSPKKNIGKAGSNEMTLLTKVKLTTQRERGPPMIIPQSATTSQMGETGYDPGDPEKAMLRVRELMSRLSTFLPAPAPVSFVREVTPTFVGREFAAEASAPTRQESAALAPRGAVKDGVPAVHPNSIHPGVTDKRKSAVTDAAGEPEDLGKKSSASQSPTAALHAGKAGAFQAGSLQTPRIRGSVTVGRGRSLNYAAVDWSPGSTLVEAKIPTMEPLFAITGTENFTDAVALATYVALMRILDAAAALRQWADHMLASVGAAAETMLRNHEGRNEEGEPNEAAQMEKKQGLSAKQGLFPVSWADTRV